MKKLFMALSLLAGVDAFSQTLSPQGQIPVRSIAQLRTLTPADTTALYYLMQRGQEGLWRYDATDITSPDNTGTVVVAAGGKRFKRVISDGILHVNWFNVYADGKSDDRPGIEAALAFYKKNSGSISWMQFGNARSSLVTYRLSDSLRIDFNADIRGGSNTKLLFANNKPGLKLRSSESHAFVPTIYLSGIIIQQVYSNETYSSNESGIEINCVAHLTDVSVLNFQGNGIVMWGDGATNPPTNCDLSTLTRVRVSECRNNGYLIYGADANIIHFKDCQAIACGGAGWLDNSFLGNNYVNCQAASCSSPELTWQRGLCKYKGKVYYALHNANNRGVQNKLGRPDISPNDWKPVPEQSWISFPNVKEWDVNSFYLAGGGFLLDIDNRAGQNQRGALLNCYAELDCPPSYLGFACIKVGGNTGGVTAGLDMTSWFGLLNLNTGIKITNPATLQTTMQHNNAFAWLRKAGALEGTVNAYDTTNNFISWYDWRTYDPNTTTHTYGGNLILPTQNTPARYFGRNELSNQAFFTPFAQEIYLNDRTPGGNHHKRILMAEKVPVVSASDMTGDIVLNSITAAGNEILGWRKVGDGATGSWEPMVLAGSNVSTLDINGNKFRLRNAKTPASSTDAGNTGEICWDSKYIYVCVANNKWVRTTLSAW